MMMQRPPIDFWFSLHPLLLGDVLMPYTLSVRLDAATDGGVVGFSPAGYGESALGDVQTDVQQRRLAVGLPKFNLAFLELCLTGFLRVPPQRAFWEMVYSIRRSGLKMPHGSAINHDLAERAFAGCWWYAAHVTASMNLGRARTSVVNITRFMVAAADRFTAAINGEPEILEGARQWRSVQARRRASATTTHARRV